jgi:hypothetical protein
MGFANHTLGSVPDCLPPKIVPTNQDGGLGRLMRFSLPDAPEHRPAQAALYGLRHVARSGRRQ